MFWCWLFVTYITYNISKTFQPKNFDLCWFRMVKKKQWGSGFFHSWQFKGAILTCSYTRHTNYFGSLFPCTTQYRLHILNAFSELFVLCYCHLSIEQAKLWPVKRNHWLFHHSKPISFGKRFCQKQGCGPQPSGPKAQWPTTVWRPNGLAAWWPGDPVFLCPAVNPGACTSGLGVQNEHQWVWICLPF